MRIVCAPSKVSLRREGASSAGESLLELPWEWLPGAGPNVLKQMPKVPEQPQMTASDQQLLSH
jgi:hypothetical protein